MRAHNSTFAILMVAAIVALTAGSTAAQSQTATRRPNIVVIALDDVGFSDLGAFGSEIATPNIDSLAKNGLRYTRFDTNAVCSATRASLLTGRNAQTVHMNALASTLASPDPKDQSAYKGEIPRDAQFVSEALQRAGYATLAIGKWHLSPAYETGRPGNNASFPRQRGFDYFYGFKMGWTDQYHPQLFEGNDPIPDPSHAGYFLSEDLVDHAISRIKTSRERSPNKPVFLYLAMPVAHTPTQAPKSYVDKYVKTYGKGWDVVRQERFARQKRIGVIPRNAKLPPRENGDPAWNSLTPQQRRVYSRFMAAYAAYLQYGDEQIGRLLDYLKTSGLDKNTVVLLFSDNGAASETKTGGFRRPYGDHTSLREMDEHLDEMGGPTTQPLYPRPWAYTGGTPFRRYKLWPYLGGIRTPLILEWPGKVTDPGSIRRQYVHVVDIAPTLLAAAGIAFDDAVDGQRQIPVAGRSFLPTIRDANTVSPRTVQFFELWGNRAITSGEWRAVSMHNPGTSFDADQWQLFDTRTDPSETTDLATTNPAKLKEMQALWRDQSARYGGVLREAPPVRAQGFEDAFTK